MEDNTVESSGIALPEVTQKGHPAGLYLLFFTEMWERFSYYGMRAIFTLFMVNALVFDKATASSIYGSYTGLVYLTPLIGGYVADKYWGNRRSILVGGILMAIGQLFMFASGYSIENKELATMLMFTGLGFLIFGNGFFKPNISTMVGQLYPAGDRRIDPAFSIFYMGINLGAFIAPLVCGGLGEVYDANGIIRPEFFKWGFLAAGMGMVLSTISFELLKDKYLISPDGLPIGNRPKPTLPTPDAAPDTKITLQSVLGWLGLGALLFVIFKGVAGFDLVASFIFTACIVAPAIVISDKSLSKVERTRIWVIYILAFFVIFFWSAFEQAGASLTFFAQEQTDRNLFGKQIPASFFQSINAVAIVIFAPIFAVLWTFLGNKRMEPASPMKQAIGLLLLALGYLVIALRVKGLDPNMKVSMIWLIILYLIHTFGELCLSPIGLAMVNKLAPLRFASLLMGVWFLSTATANKFAGVLSSLYPEEVKTESVVNAKAFTVKNTGNANVYKPAGDTLLIGAVNGSIIKIDKKLDNAPKPKELSAIETFQQNLFGAPAPESDSLTTINVLAATPVTTIDSFKFKQILNKNAKYKFQYFFNEEKNNMYVLKTEWENKGKPNQELKSNIETWNLKPTKPYFLGFQIKDLYSFFMIFVGLAGSAAILLFLIVGRLVKMMGGLR